MDRRDKTNYYLDMAQVALERGTCLRRNFGAVIVKNDVIVSTGYNGAPRGRANCIDIGTCIRQKMGIPRGERYEFCRSVHAEMNAIIAAPRDQMIGATLYLVGRDMSTGKIMSDANSCTMCKRLIINAGIEKVIIRRDTDTYDTVNVHDWVENDDTLGSSMAYSTDIGERKICQYSIFLRSWMKKKPQRHPSRSSGSWSDWATRVRSTTIPVTMRASVHLRVTAPAADRRSTA